MFTNIEMIFKPGGLTQKFEAKDNNPAIDSTIGINGDSYSFRGKNMKIGIKISLAASVLMIAHPAIAQDAAPTKIKGKTEINANAENVVAVAAGSGAVARNDTGVISGATINGDTTINANSKNVIAIAAGSESTAVNEVGSINNATIDGDTTINANAENMLATAAGDKACAVNRVGVIGKNPCPR
jgi:hypothetical protein